MNEANIEVKMRILKAAKKLFANQGFDQTSVRDICSEAGVNVMMISYHFQGKENVLSAVFQSFMPFRNLTKNENDTKDPISRMISIVREIAALRINDPEMLTILQHEITLSYPRNEIVQFLIAKLWLELKELLLIGEKMGIFKYDSLDLTLIFITSSLLMSRPWEFFNGLIQDPMLDEDLMTEKMSALILGALKYSA